MSRVSGTRAGLIARRLRVRSVRLRLTALYSSLFLSCGVGLLAITYLLVDRATAIHAVATRSPGAAPARGAVVHTHLVDLHQLLEQSGIALAIMTVVSVALGWLMAGRVLRPLRAMTAATRRISEESLDQRLAVPGPRDELTELADTIDGLLERLQAAFEAQRRFAANASHELRTPLATMRASLDVAMAKPVAVPEHIRLLDQRLTREFDRVERLLEGLLALARGQHARVGAEPTVALDKIASEAVARHASQISAKQLHVDLQAAAAVVNGSETLLSRMVENVIENAISHNEPGGWIRVRPATDGPSVSLVVENGGRRLTQRDVDQLAEPFHRLGPRRTGSQAGAGLGLSIVASIAQAHGGMLDLHARSEGGMRVMIALPAVPDIEVGG
ncbi:MAG TPA: ATP-binding protein [Solirubrobacteraceae bacterium]